MQFPQAVESCLKNYAKFSGRASRSEFWYFVLFLFLLGIVTSILDRLIFGGGPGAGSPINAIASLLTLVPNLAVSARRLHDVNRSGWWLLLLFTIIGIIPLIIWDCTRGTQGNNRFGDAPQESGN